MSAHRLVTTKELASLPRSHPHRSLEVQVVVERNIATRNCEFDLDSTVFTVLGHDVISKNTVRLYFYDEWATAASFINIGDRLTLKGFVVHDVPTYRIEESSPDDLPTGESSCAPPPPPLYFITPCRGDATTLAVAQPAEQGDVIEVLVRPPSFEPSARVVKQGSAGGRDGVSLASGCGKVLDDGMSRAS